MGRAFSAKVRNWFRSPVFAGEEEKTRRASLLHTTIISTLLYFGILIFARIFEYKTQVSLILVDIVSILGVFLLYRQLQRGKIAFVASALIILVFTWTTAVGLIKGTIRTPSTASYIFVVLLAGLLFDKRGIFFSGLGGSLAVLGLILAENAGLLPQPDYTVTLIQWITYTFLVGLTGGLGFYNNRVTREALARAETEISERRHTEQALVESETRFRMMFEGHDAIMLLLDPQSGKILDVNRAAEKFYGYPRSALRSMSMSEINTLPPDELFQARQDAINGKKNTFTFHHRLADGEMRAVEVHSSPIMIDQQPVLFSIIHDITQRKKMEDELKRWAHIFEYAEWGVTVGSGDEKSLELMNPAFARMHGYTAEELTGKPILTVFAPEVWTEVSKDIRISHEKGHHVWESIHIRKDGSRFPALIDVTAVKDDQGMPLYRIVNVQDITERKQMENELRQSRERYRLLAENISDVIWILDMSTQRFIYVSPSVERLRGYTAEEVLEQDIASTLTAESLKAIQAKIPARLKAFHQGQQNYYVDELSQPCKDGTIVWTEATTNFQINETSGRLEVYGVSRDITDRKRNEAILQTRLEMLEYAADHTLDEFMQEALDRIAAFTDSRIGFYHFVEPDQKTLSLQAWSTRTLREFCTATGKGLHYNVDEAGVWVDCVRERKPVIHNDYSSLPHRKGMPVGHAPVIRELVVPVYRGDMITSILGVGNKPTDYDEKDIQVVSYLADVFWETVKRKQAEQSFKELESRLHLLSQNLEGVGLYVYSHDASGKPHFEYLSTSMEIITGVTVEDGLGDASSLHATILREYIPLLVQQESESKEHLSPFEMEIRQKHAVSGDVRWMLLRSTPRRREDGSTVWYGVQVDITERKYNQELLEQANQQLLHQMEEIKIQAELREQTLRDPLTGLYNRRYLNEMLDREITRARRENDDVSIVISDLDHFKLINDTYGHQIGDKFLVGITSLIKMNARESDIVCRYGGEEFLLVIPGASTADAAKRAEEIRQKCQDFTYLHDGKSLQVTMSFGIATYPTHGQDVEEVIIKADKALYLSKNRGRNRVTVWGVK